MLGLPFEEASRQSFGQRLVGIKTENPCRGIVRNVVRTGSIRLRHNNSSAIFARQTYSGILRCVINDNDFVAGVERFQSASQTESVVFGVEDGCNRRHGDSVSKGWKQCVGARLLVGICTENPPLLAKAARIGALVSN